jgi:outer membrane cobalamin receptor
MMMILKRFFMRKTFVLVFTLVYSFQLYAQPMGGTTTAARKGILTGKIFEANTRTPLEYANIAIYSATDSSLISGGIADFEGKFRVTGIDPGVYYADAKFIGYEHTFKSNINVTRNNLDVDLGIIELIPASKNISEVNVLANQNPVTYAIDRKIIDPSHFPAAANGTAADVLANTPSVVVDVEGNVTLRGSSSFTVLVDGRPTPFAAADILDQIPASTIRNIEIITNPSAKYDPDGNAGIININTKRSRLVGLSGVVTASADTYGSLNGDFLFNYKFDKINFFVGANRSDRKGTGLTRSKTESYGLDTIITISNGEGLRGTKSWSLKTGADYFINDFNTLTFNLNFDQRNRYNTGLLTFNETSSSGIELFSLTERYDNGFRDNISISLDYKKKFSNEGQELTAYAFYRNGSSEDHSSFDQFDENNLIFNGQKSWEMGDGRQFRFTSDYVHPINDKMKFETGYQLRADRDFEWNDVHWYTSPDNYLPSVNSEYYTESEFSRDIHSVYTTYNHNGGKLGYQVGLRGEYTDRSTGFSKVEEPYTINRFDLFPTLHLSLQLPVEQQLTTSYSRRISRPRSNALEPFITYVDAYNVRIGNPLLEAEYIDSYEIGYQKQLGIGFISTELYHRKTNNKIERITSLYAENIMLGTFGNIGADYSTGLEMMLNLRPTKWWMVNLMGNGFRYRVEGEINGRDIGQQSNNWNTRFSNTFTLRKTTRVQFDGTYNSPSITAQGRREGFLFTNLAVRQDLFKNKMNVTLAVRDIFSTAKFGFESSGPDFYASRNFEQKSPIFSVNVTYRINNYRQRRDNSSSGNGDGGGMMDMDGMGM